MLTALLITRRHYVGAFLLGFLLVLLGALAGCKVRPKPPAPGDSTAVETSPVDSDDVMGDTIQELTPTDTLISHRTIAADRGVGFGVSATGLAFGLSQLPSSLWSAGPFTAVMASTTPELLGGVLRAAARANIHFLVVAPRRLYTVNGTTVGRYSPTGAKQLCDAYLQKFPADSLTKYVQTGTLLGFSLGDDFSDAESWGGTPVTPGVAAEAMTYCKQTFPAVVPLGLRQTPAWISGSLTLAKAVDFGWSQYLTKRGTPKDFYQKAQTIADRYGFKTIRGVNVHSCHAAGGDDPCSPSELRAFLTEAVSPTGYPAACASLSWRHDEQDYTTAVRAAYADVAAIAKAQPAGSCHR